MPVMAANPLAVMEVRFAPTKSAASLSGKVVVKTSSNVAPQIEMSKCIFNNYPSLYRIGTDEQMYATGATIF